jgi:hypothetical protein
MVDHSTRSGAWLALPEVEAGHGDDSLTFSVGGKGMSWPYLARATPKGRRRRARRAGRALRPESKEMLLEAAPGIYFDDAHYRGYPAVLVRLDGIDEAELAGLLEAAWRIQAPQGAGRRRDADG